MGQCELFHPQNDLTCFSRGCIIYLSLMISLLLNYRNVREDAYEEEGNVKKF